MEEEVYVTCEGMEGKNVGQKIQLFDRVEVGRSRQVEKSKVGKKGDKWNILFMEGDVCKKRIKNSKK